LTKARIASAILHISTILLTASALSAQSPQPPVETAATELPEAPSAIAAQNVTSPSGGAAHISTEKKMASVHRMRISENEIAPKLTNGQTVTLALENAVSPFAMAGWLSAAGWSHLVDSAPNYGTDSGAFGQRLGAATIRGISENIFANAVMAPILHEDIRYYRLGRHSGHTFIQRSWYAATRVFVTKKDDGESSINYSLLTGNLEGVAFTPLYYPERNRTVGTVFGAYAGSLGGAALGFLVNEFYPDALSISRLRKAE
jgi:hypothetical protein